MIEKYAKPGISVNMLFPETLVNEDAQLDAFKVCCDFEKYEALDIFLPEDSVIRHYVLKLLTKSGKSTNYNAPPSYQDPQRSEEHTSELQSRPHLVCRLLLEKKKKTK